VARALLAVAIEWQGVKFGLSWNRFEQIACLRYFVAWVWCIAMFPRGEPRGYDACTPSESFVSDILTRCRYNRFCVGIAEGQGAAVSNRRRMETVGLETEGLRSGVLRFIPKY